MTKTYITTSIAYPNADPHVGYALELVQADFLARYHRLMGGEVYFLTGIDEHGTKIQTTAAKINIAPQAFVDEKAGVFTDLNQQLGTSISRFIRTTDEDHRRVAQAFWRRCFEKGDIYKKKYRAWYNVKEEEFLASADEVSDSSTLGVDPQYIELIEEENYFFALSQYKNHIVELLTSGSLQIFPDSRRNELLRFVEEKGLQDVSISRDKNKLSWGISVPEDDSQVMYVWFDALTNYLTAVSEVDGQGNIMLGDWWPAAVHCIGKDISRFHALLWPGMLLSAGIELPRQILIHGFLTSGGQKMSKSSGNVVDPFTEIAEYGADPLRWFLLKEVPTTRDADYTTERLIEVYTADLANDFGNLVSRVWTMVQKYSEGIVPQVTEEQTANVERALMEEKWREYHQAVEAREIDKAVGVAHQMIVLCNRRIDELKPWQMAKDESRKAELNEFLYELLEIIRQVTLMISPVMPQITARVQKEVFPEVGEEIWSSFTTGSEWGKLVPGSTLGTDQVILFPKS